MVYSGHWHFNGSDWAHYADIYMAKFEKEALYKAALKPHTYYRYLDDVFIVWPHGKKAFYRESTVRARCLALNCNALGLSLYPPRSRLHER